MRTKKVKWFFLTFMFSILCICIMIIQTNHSKDKDNIAKNEKESNEIENNESTITKFALKDKRIIQWEYNNNGKFKMFIDDDIDWIDKKAIANKKMDISMVDLNEYLKYRKCTIAVIDSGINIENAILKRHLWKNTDEKIDNIDNDANGYVDDICGYNFKDNNTKLFSREDTSIANILCTNSTEDGNFEENEFIEFMPLKIMQQGNDGECDDLVDAILYAQENGAEICVVSLLMFKENLKLKKVIKESNMLFVVAAGNYNLDIDEVKMYPSSYNFNNVVTVGSFRCDGCLSTTSNYGESVDIVAPGTDILCLTKDNKVSYMGGTSFAVPYVAKACAIIYSMSEEIKSANEMKKILLDVASKNKCLKGKIKDNNQLNILNIIQKLKEE